VTYVVIAANLFISGLHVRQLLLQLVDALSVAKDC